MPEYRGYSLLCKLEPNLKEIEKDILRFVEYLFDDLGIDSHNTILLSRSLGCLFLSKVAQQYDLKGLILICPFYSVKQVISDKIGTLFGGLIAGGEAEPYKNLQGVITPSLLIHGDKDNVINKSQSMMLKDVIGESAEVHLVKDMGHEMSAFFSSLVPIIDQFLELRLKISGITKIRRKKVF